MTTERNPGSTRRKILKAAFEEMHRSGFQGMRVDRVLSDTGLKKGALYHHFPSKQALGYAVLEELIEKRIRELWIDPLQDFEDPLEGLYCLYERIGEVWSDAFFSLGCPLNNLAQEMSPIDEGFRKCIGAFFQRWQDAVSQALGKGQQNGFVNPEVSPDNCAWFIIATIEGILGLTKTQAGKEIYEHSKSEFKRYLETLRASAG